MFKQQTVRPVAFLLPLVGIALGWLPNAHAEESERGYNTTPIRVDENPTHDKLRQILERPTTVDFVETPLLAVLEFLKDTHQIDIEVDQRALDDLGIAIDTPITRELTDVSLRAVLDLILHDLDLTYRIDSEVLIVTSLEEAETQLEVVIYPVGDLLPTPQDGEFCHRAFMDMIVTKTSPTSWDEVGGPGSINGFRDAVVVLQTEEVHRQIDELLQGLRQLSHTPMNDRQRSEQSAE